MIGTPTVFSSTWRRIIGWGTPSTTTVLFFCWFSMTKADLQRSFCTGTVSGGDGRARRGRQFGRAVPGRMEGQLGGVEVSQNGGTDPRVTLARKGVRDVLAADGVAPRPAGRGLV